MLPFSAPGTLGPPSTLGAPRRWGRRARWAGRQGCRRARRCHSARRAVRGRRQVSARRRGSVHRAVSVRPRVSVRRALSVHRAALEALSVSACPAASSGRPTSMLSRWGLGPRASGPRLLRRRPIRRAPPCGSEGGPRPWTRPRSSRSTPRRRRAARCPATGLGSRTWSPPRCASPKATGRRACGWCSTRRTSCGCTTRSGLGAGSRRASTPCRAGSRRAPSTACSGSPAACRWLPSSSRPKR